MLGVGRILLDCKTYRYGHRLTLTDSDAANNVSKYLYANQFRPAGHESGLRTICWFYAESTGVPHNNYLQNLNHMQRGETGAKTFLLSSTMIL